MGSDDRQLVMKEFDFGWRRWASIPEFAEPTYQHVKGDLLDVGCATCELYTYLVGKGWKGKYFGLDLNRYDGHQYPQGVNLIIGDAVKTEFPQVDTVTLYNILEHVDDNVSLLAKSLKAARQNVLINVPKRNELMWRSGIVEYHQLDKSHKHCGFSKDEVLALVDRAGGKVTETKEFGAQTLVPLDLRKRRLGLLLLNPKIGKNLFAKRTFFTEIWCEIVRR